MPKPNVVEFEPPPEGMPHRGVDANISLEWRLYVGATDEVFEFSISAGTIEADRQTGRGGIMTQQPKYTSQLPRSLFGDAEPEEVFRRVADNFDNLITQTAQMEAVLLFAVVVNFTLLGFNDNAPGALRQGIITSYLAKVEERARELFRVPPQKRGRFSHWPVVELNAAAIEAASNVTGRITAEKVARRLQKKHGEKAPKSSKALLQLLRRNGLKWALIVGLAERRRAKRQQ